MIYSGFRLRLFEVRILPKLFKHVWKKKNLYHSKRRIHQLSATRQSCRFKKQMRSLCCNTLAWPKHKVGFAVDLKLGEKKLNLSALSFFPNPKQIIPAPVKSSGSGFTSLASRPINSCAWQDRLVFKSQFGLWGGSLVMTVCLVKCLRSAFSDCSRQAGVYTRTHTHTHTVLNQYTEIDQQTTILLLRGYQPFL